MRFTPRRLGAVLLVGVVGAGTAGIAHVATAQPVPTVQSAAKPPLPPRSQPATSVPTGDDPVELIVGLKRGAGVAASAARIDRIPDVELDRQEPEINAVVVDTTADEAAAELADLRRDPSVAYAEVNGRYYASDVQPNDPWAWRQENFVRTGMRTAWQHTTGASDVTVAVLDTGVKAVPELYGALLPGRNFINANDNANSTDDEGHGTMVASLVGGNTDNGVGLAGACWTCRILPVKVLDQSGRGSFVDIAEGIRYAVSQNVDVINLSLGGPQDSATVKAAVKTAVDQGILVVAAAGNEGRTPNATQKQYPAALPGVLAVGATDDNDRRYNFSNYGPWVDVAAPGRAWMSAIDGQPIEAFGTSFAAPLVAGVAALMVSAQPEVTAAELERILTSTAVNPDGSFAHGRVDAAAAVTALPFTGRATPSVRVTGPPTRLRRATTTITVATGAQVASVQGLEGTTDLGTDTAAPWTITWNPDAGGSRAADGARYIDAVVTGTNGEKTTERVWMALDRTAPKVTGATPAQNTRHRGIVTVTPTGVSDTGGIASAALWVGGKVVGTDTTAPYAVKYNLAKHNGPLWMQWRITDKPGNFSVYNRTIIVDNTSPTVRISGGPKNKAKVKGTVKVTVAASDASGIGRVELLVNGKKVGTDTTAPYTFSVVVSKYGKTLKVSARGFDKVGNQRTEPPRTWTR